MMEVMGNNLRRLREERGLTLRDVAEMTGHSFSQIQKLEKGDRRLSFMWKQRLAHAFECHPDDLDTSEVKIDVPLIGIVGAGAKVRPAEKRGKAQGFNEPNVPSGFGSKKTSALEVKGDALSPMIRDGFRLYFDDRAYGVPEEFLGKICVIELVGGATYVKIIRKGTRPGRYHLEGLNPKDAPMRDTNIKWSAKVRFWEQP